MGVYLRDNMGCMTDFGYVILATNLLMFMTIQACTCTFLVHDPNRLRVPVDLARTRSKSRSTGTILIVPVPVP